MIDLDKNQSDAEAKKFNGCSDGQKDGPAHSQARSVILE